MCLVFLLAVSVSLDTLSVGMAYSAAGIKIPGRTKGIIALINGALTLGAVLLGRTLRGYVPEIWFRFLGGVILVFLGGRTLWNSLGENKTPDCDTDHSHVLDPREGVILGLSLALDSVTAALGLGGEKMTGYLFSVFIVVMGCAFLTIGEKLVCSLRRLNGMGGVILIVLGLFRIFFVS